MPHENNQPSPLAAFERTLAGFAPAAPQLDRDRLMFLAGQASVERYGSRGAVVSTPVLSTKYSVLSTPYLWPASTAVLAASTILLAASFLRQPEPRTVLVERHVQTAGPDATSRVVVREESSQRSESGQRELARSRISSENYLRTREVALRMGLDAIGHQPSGSGLPAPTYGDLLLDLSDVNKPAPGDKPRSSLPFNM